MQFIIERKKCFQEFTDEIGKEKKSYVVPNKEAPREAAEGEEIYGPEEKQFLSEFKGYLLGYGVMYWKTF